MKNPYRALQKGILCLIDSFWHFKAFSICLESGKKDFLKIKNQTIEISFLKIVKIFIRDLATCVLETK